MGIGIVIGAVRHQQYKHGECFIEDGRGSRHCIPLMEERDLRISTFTLFVLSTATVMWRTYVLVVRGSAAN